MCASAIRMANFNMEQAFECLLTNQSALLRFIEGENKAKIEAEKRKEEEEKKKLEAALKPEIVGPK